nr:hypothetical protein [Marvinbryantia formatexigens]
MMKMLLDEMIYHRLAECRALGEKLAVYADGPAIFNTEFPSDQQEGWGGMNQYPRICYRTDMQVNQERSSSGTLHVAVYTDRTSRIIEELETQVRECLKDVLMKPSDQAPFCVAWARTETYQMYGSAVLCRDILFDVIEFPAQETTDPDPVMAVAEFIKKMFPDAVVLGVDRIGDFVNPADKPVFYCRLQDIHGTTGPCMHTVSWFIAGVAVHLLYPTALTRLKMIASINQIMQINEEIIMPDQSPMMIRELRMDNKADYLREGQLLVTGKYGCLRGAEKKHNMDFIGMGFTDY